MPSSKPTLGVNDLQSQYPDIAAEAYGWDPSTITKGSCQKKDWKCKEGHLYFSTVANHTCGGNGCPVCDGMQVLAGFNDLQSLFPDIAAEAYGWDPTSKSFGSAARAPSKISKISPRWRTHEADNGTPRASSTIEMAVVNFSIESMDHFPATRRLSASLMLDGTIEETSPP